MKFRSRNLKIFFLLLTFWSLTISPGVSAWEPWERNDPFTHQWNMLDLLVARPLGVAVSVAGAGLFVLSLPFTIAVDVFSKIKHQPSSAIKDSATMFMLEPLKFSFTREFPDENM